MTTAIDKGASGPLARRRRTLVIVLGAAVAVAAMGLTSPLWIKSPQQLAAEAEPPLATVLTAPVERRVLRDVVVLRGEIRAAETYQVTPGSSTGGAAIVTRLDVGPGDTVESGDVVLEVSGRPLVVLHGKTPAYRDLKPGAEGADVAQLQRALRDLGYEPGDREGWFGAGTKRALAEFYHSRGYDPLPASDTDDELIRSARAQIVAADRQVEDARELVETLEDSEETTDQQMRQALTSLTRAREDLDAARAELARVEATTGPMLPLNEYVFLPTRQARIEGLAAAVGTEVQAPLVTFAVGELVVVADLTTAQRTLCKVGAPVEITGDGGWSRSGVIATISDTPGPAQTGGAVEADATGYPMVVTSEEGFDPEHAGQNVRLTVEVASSEREELVVPLAALYLSADGSAYVNKWLPDGHEEPVVVEPGMSAQGYVAVAATSGRLGVGDLVTVGGEPQ